MGLGKTIEMISVILANPHSRQNDSIFSKKIPGNFQTAGTLIVCPASLVYQWEKEISTKVSKKMRKKINIYHGNKKLKSAQEIESFDIVVSKKNYSKFFFFNK
jgi:SNF2 family DNA or RNA helicase